MPRPVNLCRLLPCLALSICAALPADAGDPGFARLDRDGSGLITRAEALALRAEVFARLDADGSGLVSAAELAAIPVQPGLPGPDRLLRQDADGNGQLSLAEFNARMPGFDRADSNRDDQLTPAEFGRFAGLITPLFSLLP